MAHSLSRPNSRLSGNGSQKSRSLVKRSIEVHDLNAADLLIERFTAWKIIVKQLISYFEGYAIIQNSASREMVKLSAIIQVPFRSGNQFLGEGGLQDVFYDIRDKSKLISDQHADLGRTINSAIVLHLQKLLVEIKAHLENIQNDTAKLALNVTKERETSAKLIGELANDISVFRNTPMSITAKRDPYIANQRVLPQLQKQVVEENLLQKSVIVMQQQSAHFEEGIVRAIKSAWQTFDEWQSRTAGSIQDMFHSVSSHLTQLPPEREWISFAARSNHLLDPETPLRDPSYIHYPNKTDPSVFAVHTGILDRKKRYSRGYQESYFVLTAAGFLHAFADSDPSHPSGRGLSPIFSLFLPHCTLGPPSAANSKAHRFHIEGRTDGTGTNKSGSFRKMFGRDSTPAWTFRTRSREEMMEWWNDMRMLCARYLVASEQVERDGPVETAVRAVGYHTDEERDDSSDNEVFDEGYHEGPRPLGHTSAKGLPTIESTGKHHRTEIPPPFFESDGVVMDDTAHLAHQNTSSSHARATGYVPDELRHDSDLAEHEIQGGYYAHPVASTAKEASYESGQDAHRARRLSSPRSSPIPRSHRDSHLTGSAHQNITHNDEPSYTGEHL
ncbi:hypothetical protein AGABI1DRAFT_107696 [Agaricus bisporus var. burnettii JB137-S8]|uniref:PH domain-containing protein n=2 Tax=Agaricus bisporus var. burnettii TaxID=192524 RepID=K5WR69_AGABU|nr:uncharacterized protein AGABI1DRAFT_107696 [Agaricus bisporus var. burnettii JB137-S8]EKM77876.1 hypothetical protein AGABI1DRAFT_107696 [Agaricus bisporus var. burnettii JB137-S8]KAF7773102.1 hypothetical protein Agabi119p4_5269 [Agaricus bisporus var. burnettii]